LYRYAETSIGSKTATDLLVKASLPSNVFSVKMSTPQKNISGNVWLHDQAAKTVTQEKTIERLTKFMNLGIKFWYLKMT